MPCLRHSSATGAPASCSFRMPMICSSVYRDRFILSVPLRSGLYLLLADFSGSTSRFERDIGDLPNHPQRMIRPNPLLKIYVAEKTAANPVITTHRDPHFPLQGITMRKISN